MQCKSSVWLQGLWLTAGMTADSVKLKQLEQNMGGESTGGRVFPKAPSPSLGRRQGPGRRPVFARNDLLFTRQ